MPWHQPWSTELPKNLTTGNDYRGINVFVLESMGYTNPYWLTYNQAKKLGGYIRRGERSTPVVFWKRLESARENPNTGQVETIETPLLRYYRVFNVHQCEGLDGKIPPLAFRTIPRD